MIQDNIELTSSIRAYAIRVATLQSPSVSPFLQYRKMTDLLPHFPQALQTAEQVAAPQQLAANPKTYKAVSSKFPPSGRIIHIGHTVPMLGTASNGKERRAPMLLDGVSK
jgi:hypothetical protein